MDINLEGGGRGGVGEVKALIAWLLLDELFLRLP